MRLADTPTAIPTDSLKRVCPDDATPEALHAQIAAFKAQGGKVQQIPAGATAYTPARPATSAQSRGGQKGAEARRGKPGKREIPKIRMEDGL